MKRDLPGTVRRVAEFIGVNATEQIIEDVCEQSSFAYMKRIDAKFPVLEADALEFRCNYDAQRRARRLIRAAQSGAAAAHGRLLHRGAKAAGFGFALRLVL